MCLVVDEKENVDSCPIVGIKGDKTGKIVSASNFKEGELAEQKLIEFSFESEILNLGKVDLALDENEISIDIGDNGETRRNSFLTS
jgi:hypothetical protein